MVALHRSLARQAGHPDTEADPHRHGQPADCQQVKKHAIQSSMIVLATGEMEKIITKKLTVKNLKVNNK